MANKNFVVNRNIQKPLRTKRFGPNCSGQKKCKPQRTGVQPVWSNHCTDSTLVTKVWSVKTRWATLAKTIFGQNYLFTFFELAPVTYRVTVTLKTLVTELILYESDNMIHKTMKHLDFLKEHFKNVSIKEALLNECVFAVFFSRDNSWWIIYNSVYNL